MTFEELEAEATSIAVDDITELGRGLDGQFGERPERLADVRFQSWVMNVLGTDVVIVIKSYADATPARVAEAQAVVDSIRVAPGADGAGYRLVFELGEGWDSG